MTKPSPSPTTKPASYFPYMAVLPALHLARLIRKGGKDWAKVATPAGRRRTGPFHITRVVPRSMGGGSCALGELPGTPPGTERSRQGRADADPTKRIRELAAIARRTGRLGSKCRPADGHRLVEIGGFCHYDRLYPPCLALVLQHRQRANSPFKDVRVRQALNYCTIGKGWCRLLQRDRGALGGLVSRPAIPISAIPVKPLQSDPAKGKALLAEAGYTVGKAIILQGVDLEFRLGANAAFADERIPAAKSERGPAA